MRHPQKCVRVRAGAPVCASTCAQVVGHPRARECAFAHAHPCARARARVCVRVCVCLHACVCACICMREHASASSKCGSVRARITGRMACGRAVAAYRSSRTAVYVVMAICSYGLYSYDLHSYGLYSYGLCSYAVPQLAHSCGSREAVETDRALRRAVLLQHPDVGRLHSWPTQLWPI